LKISSVVTKKLRLWLRRHSERPENVIRDGPDRKRAPVQYLAAFSVENRFPNFRTVRHETTSLAVVVF